MDTAGCTPGGAIASLRETSSSLAALLASPEAAASAEQLLPVLSDACARVGSILECGAAEAPPKRSRLVLPPPKAADGVGVPEGCEPRE